MHDLLNHSAQVFINARGARGAGRRVKSRLQRLNQGSPLADETARASQQAARRHNKLWGDRRQAVHVRSQLELGSISRASRVLARLQHADPTDETVEGLWNCIPCGRPTHADGRAGPL